MIAITQLKNKARTHGVIAAALYSAQYLVRPAWQRVWTRPVLKSYSQRFEDRIIDRILGGKVSGTYLEIGAFDPCKFSNTKRFYDRGWRGCNVEPHPERFRRIAEARPEDINLNMGVSGTPGTLTFFELEQGEYSTFSEARAIEMQKGGLLLVEKMEIPVITMASICETHFAGRGIDFCAIDTEGMDLAILKGNDWKRFRPRVLCIEVTLPQAVGDSNEQSLHSFLEGVNYRLRETTVDFGVPLNAIYVSEE